MGPPSPPGTTRLPRRRYLERFADSGRNTRHNDPPPHHRLTGTWGATVTVTDAIFAKDVVAAAGFANETTEFYSHEYWMNTNRMNKNARVARNHRIFFYPFRRVKPTNYSIFVSGIEKKNPTRLRYRANVPRDLYENLLGRPTIPYRKFDFILFKMYKYGILSRPTRVFTIKYHLFVCLARINCYGLLN